MVTKLLCHTCTSGPDGRERAQRQWPTMLGHGRHVVVVHRRRLGQSGQRADKRVVPLLLAPTRFHSPSFALSPSHRGEAERYCRRELR